MDKIGADMAKPLMAGREREWNRPLDPDEGNAPMRRTVDENLDIRNVG